MSQRIEKINEIIRQQLGQFIIKEIEMPPNCLVTITSVETSADIRYCKVFITVLPENMRGTALEILQKNSLLLHNLLKGSLSTKFVPNLKFQIDEQEVFAAKVDKILDEIKKG